MNPEAVADLLVMLGWALFVVCLLATPLAAWLDWAYSLGDMEDEHAD